MVKEAADLRLWLVRLDEALEPHLARGERRFAKKDAKGLVEDLAFRSALLDDRLVPEEKDYERALAAVKPPESAAAVLARRRPTYRRRAVAATVRGWAILLLLVLGAFGASQLASSETAEPLAVFTHAEPAKRTGPVQFTSFPVPAGLERVDVTVHATNLDYGGAIRVAVLDAGGNILYDRSFSRESRVYDHANLAPENGPWRALIEYADTKGAVRVEVVGVRG